MPTSQRRKASSKRRKSSSDLACRFFALLPFTEFHVHPDGKGEYHAADDEFQLGRNGEEGHAVEQAGHDQRAENNTEHGAAATAQARAADHARGDGVEFHLVADRGGRGAAVGGLHQAGDGDDAAEQGEGANDDLLHGHAGDEGRLLVAADGV